jgi:hypothetical protein
MATRRTHGINIIPPGSTNLGSLIKYMKVVVAVFSFQRNCGGQASKARSNNSYAWTSSRDAAWLLIRAHCR